MIKNIIHLVISNSHFLLPEVHPHRVGTQEGVIHGAEQLLVVLFIWEQTEKSSGRNFVSGAEPRWRGHTNRKASSCSPHLWGGGAVRAAGRCLRTRWLTRLLMSSSYGARSAKYILTQWEVKNVKSSGVKSTQNTRVKVTISCEKM